MMFIIYKDSDEEKVKCIEGINFSYISTEKLQLLLGCSIVGTGTEYQFEYGLTKDQVLAYLFDIQSIDGSNNAYKRYVGKGEGYVLYNLQGKIRNFFEISGNDYYLRFQNQRCLAKKGPKDGDEVVISFNPVAFDKLISNPENERKLIFLLASNDIVLFIRSSEKFFH